MSAMVERVAKALCVADGHDAEAFKTDYETGGRGGGILLPNRHLRWLDYVKKAEAAIAAMREPTSNMIAAGRNAIKMSDATSRFDLAEAVWRDMVNRAEE